MKLIIILVLWFCVALLAGFIWMIGLGILSHIFHAKHLAIGFWPSVVVAFVVNLLIGGIRVSKD